MKWLTKLFGGTDKHGISARLKEIEGEVERRNRPLRTLSLSIVRESDVCSKAICGIPEFDDQRKKVEVEMKVFYEFVYFFLHLTMRSAHRMLTEEEIGKLQSYLGHVVIGSSIDAYSSELLEDQKKEVRSDFYRHLNAAEFNYAGSRELMSKEKPFTGDSLVSKLARNVSIAMGSPSNPELLMAAIDIVTESLVRIEFDQLVGEARPAIGDLQEIAPE